MYDQWHERRLSWICNRANDDSEWEDAHVYPDNEKHEISRDCYCHPALLCRKCMKIACAHPVSWGRIVSHNQAS